jgi:hypothetical protein
MLILAPAQEELIQELTTQISRLTPMLKEGRMSTLPLLTNEAANKEKRILEERLKEVREELRKKDGVIKDKDTRIAALNDQRTSRRSRFFLPSTHGPTAVETTQADLKAEIAHTQTLQNNNPKAPREPLSSTIRARTSLANDPKHGVTMRLYEDLTNLIVMSAKIQASPYAHLGVPEEITYRCVFSHSNSGRYRHLSLLCSSTDKVLQQVYRSCSRRCTNPIRHLIPTVHLLRLGQKTIFKIWCTTLR